MALTGVLTTRDPHLADSAGSCDVHPHRGAPETASGAAAGSFTRRSCALQRQPDVQANLEAVVHLSKPGLVPDAA